MEQQVTRRGQHLSTAAGGGGRSCRGGGRLHDRLGRETRGEERGDSGGLARKNRFGLTRVDWARAVAALT